MGNAYHEGGWGMYPTTIMGILLVSAAIYYALKPERRNIWIVASVALMTFLAGVLGFTVGVINTMRTATSGEIAGEPTSLALGGVGESLNNVALAFVFLILATIFVTVGVLRGRGRGAEAQTSLARAGGAP